MSSFDCVSQLTAMYDIVNAGVKPYPLFFTEAQCSQNKGMWPALPEDVTYETKLDVSHIMCEGHSSNIAECVLPMLGSLVLPDNLSVRIWPTDMPASAAGYIEYGNTAAMNLTADDLTKKKLMSKNAMDIPFNGSVLQNFKYGDLTFDDECKNGIKAGTGYSASGKLLSSNYSCGSPFNSMLAWTGPNLKIANGSYVGCSNDDCSADINYCTVVASGSFTPNSAFSNWNTFQSSGNTVTCGDVPIKEAGCGTGKTAGASGCACISNKTGAVNAIDQDDANVCDSGWHCPIACSFGNTCPCPHDDSCRCEDGAILVSGGVGYIEIAYNGKYGSSFILDQASACSGLTSSQFAGIKLTEYQSGTPLCDDIMNSVCLNSAFLEITEISKACSCITEKSAINAQFGAIDLPVQCFSESCNSNVPGVYKTSEESVSCDARLCQQTFILHGNAIVEQGQQNMICNGIEYNVKRALPVSASVPAFIPSISPPHLDETLGPTFFVVLGILLVLILLVVVWTIRRFAVHHKKEQEERKALVGSLTNIEQSLAR